MQKPTVVLSNNGKSVTIVGVNGDTVSRNASSTLNLSFRKDGGVTVWVDGEHKSQTTRTDKFGRLTSEKRAAPSLRLVA